MLFTFMFLDAGCMQEKIEKSKRQHNINCTAGTLIYFLNYGLLMQVIQLHPHQIISMNDYPPLHSPNALRKYHTLFQKNNLGSVTPIPVVPVSVVVTYLQKYDARFVSYSKQLEGFLEKHPHVKYFMFDGTHRAAAAMLSAHKIPAYLIRNDEDIQELFSLRDAGKISLSGLKENLADTLAVIEKHYHSTKKFWTLEEKVHLMISHGDIDKDFLTLFDTWQPH